MRREVFFEIGGFTELLPLNFNDVDLCYKTRKEGYRIVWVANCEAYHFESRTRINKVESWEKEIAVRRWGWPTTTASFPAWPTDQVRKYQRQGSSRPMVDQR